MNRKSLFLFLLCIPVLGWAQKKNKQAVKAAATITAADMKKHLYVIASAEMGGRDTPSPGLEKAADYIEAHFKSLGLLPGNKDSYRQYYPLYRDSMVSTHLRVNEMPFTLNTDFQPSAGYNHSAEMRFSEAVFVGYGIADGTIDNYAGLEVQGKLVIIVDGTPAGYKAPASQRNAGSMFGKISAAARKGAAGILVVSNTFPRKTMAAPGNWSMNGYKATANPFTFSISDNVLKAIMGADAAGFWDKMKENTAASKTYKANIDLSYFKQTVTTQVSNVLGLLEGTDLKEEYVVLTAHYDHVGKRNDTTIYYGADDDGSGTTGILELAEAFVKAKQAGHGPRRSILFMTVSGEEKGLWGSYYYANHPVYPLEKTTVDLNIDMIGRTGSEYLKDKDSTNYIYIIGDDKLSSDLAVITDQVNRTYSNMKLDRKYNDPNDPNRFYFRSDHYNFAEKGVPIIFYFNGTHADYHRPTDTPDKINYPMMAKRTQLVFHTAWEMANRNEMLKRDIELVKPKGF
jgi:Zn-dependent M28 family amino/carboxypeptidase